MCAVDKAPIYCKGLVRVHNTFKFPSFPLFYLLFIFQYQLHLFFL